jgi:uncharacterized protein (DUF1786 family)
MNRFLLVDIGAGTMDILFYDLASGLHYKAVARSPVLDLADQAAALKGPLVVTGTEMGGGSISRVLKDRARENEVIMSASAALTINHNLDRVRATGIHVVNNTEAEALTQDSRYTHLCIKDLQPERLCRLMESLGVAFDFDVLAVCAQDHGTPPEGVSHLDYRHTLFQGYLDKSPFAHSLLFQSDELPSTFNRLRAIATEASNLPCKEVYLMDSGMAAIVGASLDGQAISKERILVLDIATSHTVGAALINQELAGFFEYHTQDITAEKIDLLLAQLADGKLKHEDILKEGGHGAYIRKAFGFDTTQLIVATGPKRALIRSSPLPITLGAPFGDNMMTGTAGLLEAVRIRKGLPPFNQISFVPRSAFSSSQFPSDV